MKQKLIYILPEFNLETDTHFFYLYGFINALTAEFDIALVIEKSHSDTKFFQTTEVRLLNANSKFIRSIKLFQILLQLRLRGYRHVYVHYSYLGALMASGIMRLTGGKVWYWNCGMPWLYGRQLVLRLVLKVVDYLVTGSESMGELYARYMNVPLRKIKILPTWIDIADFKEKMQQSLSEQYRLPENIKIVLFVHRLSKRKGAQMIAPVAKQFLDDSNIHFVVAGSGPYESLLRREIAEQNLKNITLLGRVPNKCIPALLKKSAVYFMPSEEEGVPRALLEAIVAGVPYVVSDIGGVGNIYRSYGGGVLVNVGDTDELVVALRAQLHQPTSIQSTIRHLDIAEAIQQFTKLFYE